MTLSWASSITQAVVSPHAIASLSAPNHHQHHSIQPHFCEFALSLQLPMRFEQNYFLLHVPGPRGRLPGEGTILIFQPLLSESLFI